jgi:hypothetical protein
MPKPFPGPGPQVIDRELGRGLIKLPAHEFSTNDAKDFDIHNVGSGMVFVCCQPPPHRLGPRRTGEDLS